MKFGMGQAVRRAEDLPLLSGRGCYTDDITLPATVIGYLLRSPVAHAKLLRIDAEAARSMPGVLLILTGDDVKRDGLGDIPCLAPLTSRDGKPRYDTPRPVLGTDRVRHVDSRSPLSLPRPCIKRAMRRRLSWSTTTSCRS